MQANANWPAVGALAFGLFGLVTTELLPIGLIPPMAADLGVSEGAAGQAITATAIVAATTGPILVLFSGRLDRQKVVWMLGLCFLIAALLCVFATTLPLLLAARALLGVALGGTWAMAIALAMRLVPEGSVSRALAVIFTGVSIANVIAAPLGSWLSDILSWRAAFAMSAAFALIALTGQVATMPKLPAATPPSLASFRIALRKPAVLIGLATAFFVLCGNTAGISFLRPFLEGGAQINVTTVSLVLLTFGVAGFFGNLLGGALSARSPALAAGCGALAIAGATAALASQGQLLAVVFVATAVWGIGFGAFPVAISSWNAQAAPDQAESAGALLSTSFQLAIAGGGVLGGLMIERLSETAPIYTAGVAALVGAAVVLLIGRPSERRRTSHQVQRS
ncbi:MFS transporter [Pseudoroseicyclus aestuarii]|nr:MFS transporter [Pseudoroseicyclus aestuarii]